MKLTAWLKITAVLALVAITVCGCGDYTLNAPTEGLSAVYTYAGKGGVETSAMSAILLEAETRRILYAHNVGAALPMASTTKIMTAIVALEHGDLQTETTITAEAVGVEGSSVYLTVGERFTREELLYALLLESGNDAAVALAISVAGSVNAFVSLMNTKAAELGLKSTHFENPHGLSAEGHRTSAYDLALITAHALSLDGFEKISSTVSKRLEGEGHLPRYLVNHNKLLRSYEGLIGVKTGYTLLAGRCLVTAARRNGMTLIAVTLNDRNDWQDHTALLDYGFGAFRMLTVAEAGVKAAVPVTGGKKASATAVCSDTVRICTTTDSDITKLFVTIPIAAPIKRGQKIAVLKVFENGTIIKEVPLTAIYDVEKGKRRLYA